MDKAVFVNVSNHKSEDWSKKQTGAAKEYGEIIDIPFPNIDPGSSSAQIDKLVEQYYEEVLQLQPAAVMLQGEFVFTYRLVNRLKAAGIIVLASSTERRVMEKVMPDGTVRRNSIFEFVAFRKY